MTHYLTIGAAGQLTCSCGQQPGYITPHKGGYMAVNEQEPRRPNTPSTSQQWSIDAAREWVLRQHLYAWIRNDPDSVPRQDALF